MLGTHSVLLGLRTHLQWLEKSQPGPLQRLNNDRSSSPHVDAHTQYVLLIGTSREGICYKHKCVQSHGSRQHSGLLWSSWTMFAAPPPQGPLPQHSGLLWSSWTMFADPPPQGPLPPGLGPESLWTPALESSQPTLLFRSIFFFFFYILLFRFHM